MMDDDVAIVGVYETEQARRLPHRRTVDLFLEATKGALDDAGLTKEDVDGVIGNWPGPGGAELPESQGGAMRFGSAEWVKQLGITANFIDDTMFAGPVALQHAVGAIASGECETVLVVSGQCGIVPEPGSAVISYTRPANEFIGHWGATTPVEFSLLAQRHMDLFGTTVEQCAEVASSIRTNGDKNPHAVMYGRGPVSPQDVLTSREVCSPLRLLDFSLISEGAAAMIVSNRVRDTKSSPIYVRGVAGEYVGPPYIDAPVYEELRWLGRRAADRVFRRAGMSREDIQVFSLYDPTSFEVIRQFEMLGYCKEGEGGPFVMDGRIRIGGSHPTNLDGGLLSHAHLSDAQMTQKVKECVDQLRGVCGERQVAGARNALVTVAGGPARFYAAAILSSEPD
jgi:acetyl-CoA acetyltransferase